MADNKELPVKNIINIGLLIAGVLVVKKVLETIGVIQTAQEKKETEQSTSLEQGSTGPINVVNVKKPELSLNPNYWTTIFASINKQRALKKLAPLTKQQVAAILHKNLGGSDFYTAMKNYAGRIYQSKGIFNDDESRLYSVFQSFPTQIQISFLSKTFTDVYKKDMLDYIKGFTNEQERSKIFDIIKNKPLY